MYALRADKRTVGSSKLFSQGDCKRHLCIGIGIYREGKRKVLSEQTWEERTREEMGGEDVAVL